MMISESLKRATDRLKRAGIDQPRVEAELLLAFVLRKPKERLIARPETAVSATALRRFLRLIERRAVHEPVAYLVGEKWFYGRPFFVDRSTLIPRPETETLVEAVLPFLSSRAKPCTVRCRAKPSESEGSIFIFDIGTGSGAIGLTLAAELPGSTALLTDVSESALRVARKNARRLGLAARCQFKKLDVLNPSQNPFFSSRAKPDDRQFLPAENLAVVANLPYLSEAAHRKTAPNIRRYEPKSALVSGRDGLRHYRALMRRLKEWRLEPSLLALEADPRQFSALKKIVHRALPQHRLEIKKDLAGNARVLLAAAP